MVASRRCRLITRARLCGGSGNVVALAQWEGPGVLLTTQSGPGDGACPVALHSGIDVGPGPRHRASQVRVRVLRVEVDRETVGTGGWVTSCRQVASRLFFLTGLPAFLVLLSPLVATDSASRAGS